MNVKSILLGAAFVFALSAPAGADHPFAEHLDSRLVPTIVGWGSYDMESAQGMETTGIEFSNALHAGYLDLSADRKSGADLVDAEYFNHKARTAAKRSDVLPDFPDSDRHLDDFDIPVFASALHRMLAVFDRGGREQAPAESAKAQVSYDCWIEAAEYQREGDMKACRRAFETAMARAAKAADYQLTEVAFDSREAPMVAAVPSQPESFLVHFEWDSTTKTPVGRATLEESIRVALDSPSLDIVLIGHADRSGAEDYNMGLSERRTIEVIQSFVDAGIDRARISSEFFGETRPLVPTADGVREQGNRVVEVDLM